MKVMQIVPYIGDESSGPSYSVPALCRGLAESGCDVSLHVLKPIPDRDFGFPVVGYTRVKFPHPRLGFSPEMKRGILGAAHAVEIIHNSSLWMFPNVYGWLAIEKMKKNGIARTPKLVMQPRGTLSKWALKHNCFRKLLFGKFGGQYAALSATDMWVATADNEADEIRSLGYTQPICVLPNGIDLPEPNMSLHNVCRKRRMYFLSRIHPKKNVEMLIAAWAKLEKDFPDWSLSIVGPDADNPYADEMKTLTMKLGCEHICFEGELNGDDKYCFMSQSDCMVLPTHSENFGMVVAESLACGTPVICSQGAPWSGLEVNHCGWWIETEEGAFVRTMRLVMSMSSEALRKMGENGKEWMRRDFSWPGICSKLKVAYEWLVNPQDVKLPECIRLD